MHVPLHPPCVLFSHLRSAAPPLLLLQIIHQTLPAVPSKGRKHADLALEGSLGMKLNHPNIVKTYDYALRCADAVSLQSGWGWAKHAHSTLSQLKS